MFSSKSVSQLLRMPSVLSVFAFGNTDFYTVDVGMGPPCIGGSPPSSCCLCLLHRSSVKPRWRSFRMGFSFCGFLQFSSRKENDPFIIFLFSCSLPKRCTVSIISSSFYFPFGKIVWQILMVSYFTCFLGTVSGTLYSFKMPAS